MIKTDVEHIYQHQKGLLVDTNRYAYQQYLQHRAVMEEKEKEVQKLRDEINNINATMQEILKKLG